MSGRRGGRSFWHGEVRMCGPYGRPSFVSRPEGRLHVGSGSWPRASRSAAFCRGGTPSSTALLTVVDQVAGRTALPRQARVCIKSRPEMPGVRGSRGGASWVPRVPPTHPGHALVYLGTLCFSNQYYWG